MMPNGERLPQRRHAATRARGGMAVAHSRLHKAPEGPDLDIGAAELCGNSLDRRSSTVPARSRPPRSSGGAGPSDEGRILRSARRRGIRPKPFGNCYPFAITPEASSSAAS